MENTQFSKVSQKGTSAPHTKVVSLSANKLSSFLFDLEFRKELFNNATTAEAKQTNGIRM